MAKLLIKSLTTEQAAQIPVWREAWLRHGLSTGPADRAEAERGVDLAYRAADLEPPKLKIWLDSPYQGAMGAAILESKKFPPVGAQVRDQVWAQVGAQVRAQVVDQVWDQVGAQVRAQVGAQVGAQVRDQVWAQVGAQVGDQVRAQVWDQVGDQVWAQVGAQVGAQVWTQVWDQVVDQVWAQVWAQVWDQVWAQVRAQVGDQVRAQVGDQVGAQVGAQVRDQVWDQVSRAAYGQHDAGWLSFYDFFSMVCDLESAKRLEGLIIIAKSCGWWWPFQGAVILTERPRFLHRDDRGRLHNENHKAIEYPDGWGFYAIHGIRVPSDIIEQPELLTPDRIKSERNAEIRRIMMQKFGLDRYVREIGAKLISTDEVGKLWRVEDEVPFHLAEVINSTPEPDGSIKTYFLPMPDENDLTGKRMKTCREAIAWSFSLHETEYRPGVQT